MSVQDDLVQAGYAFENAQGSIAPDGGAGSGFYFDVGYVSSQSQAALNSAADLAALEQGFGETASQMATTNANLQNVVSDAQQMLMSGSPAVTLPGMADIADIVQHDAFLHQYFAPSVSFQQITTNDINALTSGVSANSPTLAHVESNIALDYFNANPAAKNESSLVHQVDHDLTAAFQTAGLSPHQEQVELGNIHQDLSHLWHG